MYEQEIAQLTIKQIKDIITQAFAQLEGKNSDSYTNLYLSIEDAKNKIGENSGLSEHTINQITALIGEKEAAKIGITLLKNFIEKQESDLKISKQKSNPTKQKAQQILREQLLIIITHHINSRYTNNHTLTFAELKLAHIINDSILQNILQQHDITFKTKVSLQKVQNIIRNSVSEIIQLITNNGKVPGQVTKIPKGKKDLLALLNSTLNIMNTTHNKGIRDELIAPPDPTPSLRKSTQKSK